jgi:ABC-type transport system substrate-binding protein
MKKAIAIILTLSLVLCLFVGCSSSDSDSTASTDATQSTNEGTSTDTSAATTSSSDSSDVASEATTPSSDIVSARDSLVIGGASEPGTLDPTNQQSMIVSQMAHLMYNTLFTMDESYNVVGDLVESYENVSDTQWNFKIYEGIKFHDGTDLTTQDIKDTLEMVRVNDFSGSYVASIDSISDSSLGNFECYIQGVANTSAIDYIRRMYHSDQIGAQNCSRYHTDELDEEITRIASILDPDERAAATYDLEGELADLCMYIPLYNDSAFRAYNSDLAGVNFNGAYFTRYNEFYWVA